MNLVKIQADFWNLCESFIFLLGNKHLCSHPTYTLSRKCGMSFNGAGGTPIFITVSVSSSSRRGKFLETYIYSLPPYTAPRGAIFSELTEKEMFGQDNSPSLPFIRTSANRAIMLSSWLVRIMCSPPPPFLPKWLRVSIRLCCLGCKTQSRRNNVSDRYHYQSHLP